MLIRSHRHRPDDLAVWEELEYADSVYAESRRFQRKIEIALERVREFLAAGGAWVACSWGKDSVVVLDLARRIKPDICIGWIRVEPIKNPDCELVRDAWIETDGIENYMEFVVDCKVDRMGIHATGTLEEGSALAVQCFGRRRITGIRSEESSVRELSAFVHGVSTANVCRPIIDWTMGDIFAYLYAHQLPVHPAYACTLGGRLERGRIRVASLGGRRGDGMGRREWELTYYPEEMAAIGEAP